MLFEAGLRIQLLRDFLSHDHRQLFPQLLLHRHHPLHLLQLPPQVQPLLLPDLINLDRLCLQLPLARLAGCLSPPKMSEAEEAAVAKQTVLSHLSCPEIASSRPELIRRVGLLNQLLNRSARCPNQNPLLEEFEQLQ